MYLISHLPFSNSPSVKGETKVLFPLEALEGMPFISEKMSNDSRAPEQHGNSALPQNNPNLIIHSAVNYLGVISLMPISPRPCSPPQPPLCPPQHPLLPHPALMSCQCLKWQQICVFLQSFPHLVPPAWRNAFLDLHLANHSAFKASSMKPSCPQCGLLTPSAVIHFSIKALSICSGSLPHRIVNYVRSRIVLLNHTLLLDNTWYTEKSVYNIIYI